MLLCILPLFSTVYTLQWYTTEVQKYIYLTYLLNDSQFRKYDYSCYNTDKACHERLQEKNIEFTVDI